MIRLNMLSSAEKVKGQGVGSAYREFINLLNKDDSNTYELTVNKNIKADITHYHTVDFWFYLSTFSRKKRGIRVGHVHFLPETLEGSLQLPFLIKKIFNRYLLSFYKRMDKLVVVNPAFIPKLEAHGIKKEKVTYIPNFVAKEVFYPMNIQEKLATRETLSIPKDTFVVMGAGQIQHRKGILDFIAVSKQLPQVQFIWVGGFSFGKMTAGYEELKKIFDHPPKNVYFTGIIDRASMNDYYNVSNLLFMPSYNELFPMTILEAMSSGLPILTRDLELYEAILEGYYIKGQTVTEFAASIEQLRVNQDHYQDTKGKARKGAQYYSEDRLWNIWKDYYHEIYRH
ncbi:glycosyltransferase family 4 protein [Marinilactibacillus sp. GCM10026970]|uniref:glycosyltransferase family 4 protein n=1 Tax=Marinilactibacillus sp. GCM10026970 TaxID=3252642 RepID=UPI00361D75D4